MLKKGVFCIKINIVDIYGDRYSSLSKNAQIVFELIVSKVGPYDDCTKKYCFMYENKYLKSLMRSEIVNAISELYRFKIYPDIYLSSLFSSVCFNNCSFQYRLNKIFFEILNEKDNLGV